MNRANIKRLINQVTILDRNKIEQPETQEKPEKMKGGKKK